MDKELVKILKDINNNLKGIREELNLQNNYIASLHLDKAGFSGQPIEERKQKIDGAP